MIKKKLAPNVNATKIEGHGSAYWPHDRASAEVVIDRYLRPSRLSMTENALNYLWAEFAGNPVARRCGGSRKRRPP